jgi:hypothetical protein
MGVFDEHPKPELSTLLESGTFYFALTHFVTLCRSKVKSSAFGKVESSS